MVRVPASADELLVRASLVRGDVEQISALAAFAADVASDCSDFRGRASRAASGLSNGEGAALRKLQRKLGDALVPGARSLRLSAGAARRGFESHAASIERLHGAAARVEAEVDQSLQTIREQSAVIEGIAMRIGRVLDLAWNLPPTPVLPDPVLDPARADGLDAAEREAAVRTVESAHETAWRNAAVAWAAAHDRIERCRDRWEALVDERRRVERSLVVALRETHVGALIRIGRGEGMHGPKPFVALAISGEFRGAPGAPGMPRTHPALRELLGTDSGDDAWEAPPDPLVTAARWDDLDEETRERLIAEVPWVIGNLPGLPFADRDRANRNAIDFYSQHPALLPPRGRRLLRDLRDVLAQGAVPPASVVALDLTGRVPRVAVGYGDLDSADYLSWQVPGMGSDADAAMRTWDDASRNLFAEQERMTKGQEFAGSIGVIAFLGYDTPDLLESLDTNAGVLSPNAARAGAERLAQELDGTWATRNRDTAPDPHPGYGAPGGPHIALVSHSYGTTAAATALTKTRYPVDAFSMAGSAGLDRGTVPSLEALNVAAEPSGRKRIFASHASADRLAPIGLVVSGRANPNPNLEYGSAANYPGAMHYSSDGFTDANGVHFKRTDGHSVIGEEIEGLSNPHRHLNRLGFEASSGRGYWDPGTQSLNNLAASALGMDHRIVGGLHANR